MTLTVQLVLRALLADPAREMYGFEVTRATGLPSGTVYPILARLKDAGWLTVRDEGIIPQEEGRPQRRYYKLTGKGIAEAREATARAAVQLAVLGVALGTPPRPAPPAIGPDLADWLSPEDSAYDEAGRDAPCEHPRVHVKGTCPDCMTYVASKP